MMEYKFRYNQYNLVGNDSWDTKIPIVLMKSSYFLIRETMFPTKIINPNTKTKYPKIFNSAAIRPDINNIPITISRMPKPIPEYITYTPYKSTFEPFKHANYFDIQFN